jgi:4-alpha-glucanotransferase
VVYTGTHDNNTTPGCYEELSDAARQNVWRYLAVPSITEDQIAPALLRPAWSSSAKLAIAPLQDVLNFPAEARMNVLAGRKEIGGGARPRRCFLRSISTG